MESPIRIVLDKLEGVKSSGNEGRQWVACCPAHPDKSQSLGVAVNNQGSVLLRCYAGCETSEVVAAMGLELRDLFTVPEPPDNGVTVRRLAFEKRIPANFILGLGVTDYTEGNVREIRIPYYAADHDKNDLDATPLFVRRRTAMRAKDGSFYEKGTKPVPYGLWMLKGWASAGKLRLILVEGETDCWALWYHGFAALGLPGADMGGKIEADHVSGFGEIVVWQEPGKAGAAFAKKCVDRLRTIGFTGKVLVYATGKDAKDPSDIAKKQGDGFAAAFEEILKGAKEPGETAESKESDKPEIVISSREFDVNDQACSALGNEEDLYQRGGMLVHVVEADSDYAKIQILKPASLRERLARCADWVEWKGVGDNREKFPAHPPKWSTEAVFHRGEWPRVKGLRAVVNHPIVKPNGDLMWESGYDSDTQILAKIPKNLKIKVVETPTRTDVDAAIAVLNDVIQDFPFQSDVYKSAWYAALFTPLMWFAFDGPAPLFLFDANTRAAGKGKLTNIIHNIVNGVDFSISNYTHNKEEMRKVITTFAVSGDRMILLDNIVGSFGNDLMAGVLTSDRWKDRILGGNLDYSGPINITWYATGNNVQLVSDLGRRVCHIRLESQLEKPENRDDYKHKDVIRFTKENRNALLSAALTIIRYWYASEKPRHKLKPWGSYDQWSIVRDIIVHAGMPDPGEARDELQDTADEDVSLANGLIAGMEIMDPMRRGMSSSEIISHVVEATKENRTRELPGGTMPRQAAEDLKSVIVDLCGKLCSRSLGYKLKHFRKRSFRGKYIDKLNNDNNIRWVVRLRTSTIAQDMEKGNSLMSCIDNNTENTGFLDDITGHQDMQDKNNNLTRNENRVTDIDDL